MRGSPESNELHSHNQTDGAETWRRLFGDPTQHSQQANSTCCVTLNHGLLSSEEYHKKPLELLNFSVIPRVFLLAEKEGFEPSRPFWGLHDFQSCALDQTTRLLHEFAQFNKLILSNMSPRQRRLLYQFWGNSQEENAKKILFFKICYEKRNR